MSSGVLEQGHGYLVGVGRLRIHYRAWEVQTPRAAIVVVHGLGEHSGRYDEFASAMAGYGFSSYALDLRGHGSSEGRRGHVARFEILLQELDRFRREVQGLVDPSCPLFLLGHSMGGLVVLRYLEEYDSPYRGAIVVSPWLATALPAPRWKIALSGFCSRFLPALPFSTKVRGKDVSHDQAVVEAYDSDPLVHDTITPRLFAEAETAMALVFQRAERLRVPLLFLLAGDDHVVDTQRSLAFARSLPAHDVTVRIYPGLYHEVLNELDRHAVRAELRDWLVKHLR
ncbi:MAG TPA: alpha/beta hydrolase [Longimicrobiales bacterium]|nr:alpha/beta hydrolase [Longimicrobiales bacterium]